MKEGNDRNVERKTNFTNTSRLTITPIKQLSIVADFSYRFYQNRTTNRAASFTYRDYPGEPLRWYGTQTRGRRRLWFGCRRKRHDRTRQHSPLLYGECFRNL